MAGAVRRCWEAVVRALSCCFDDPDHVPSQSLLTDHHEASVQQSVLSLPLEPAAPPSATAGSSSPQPAAPVQPWSPPSSASQHSPVESPKADPLAGTVPASSTVDTLETYNAMLGALASQSRREVKRSDSIELNIETCAVCLSDIVLGPQAALRRMGAIPPGEQPRHFDCGHMLHADCYAVYICSHGRACPICKLDQPGAKTARDLLRAQASSRDGSPEPAPTPARIASRSAARDVLAGPSGGREHDGGGGHEDGEDDSYEEDEGEEGEDEWAAAALAREEREMQLAVHASMQDARRLE